MPSSLSRFILAGDCRAALRTVLIALTAVLPATVGGQTTAATTIDPSRVAYLREHASTIRDIDPADTNYADLAGLAHAIGDARVVMLGEQTHGDGTTFLAKDRLIRFLHEKMGFDVVLWESGMYDTHRAWQLIEHGADPVDAAQRSVFPVWSNSEQVVPLFRYIGRSAHSAHPLELGGFDLQITGELGRDSLLPELHRYLTATGSAVLNRPEWTVVQATFDTLLHSPRNFMTISKQRQHEFSAAVDTVRALLAAQHVNDPAFRREQGYWGQLLVSTRSLAELMWGLAAGIQNVPPGFLNLRDRQMAANLMWLLHDRYAGRKVIVWAASSHISRDRAAMHDTTAPGMISLGELTHDSLGAKMYSIGFTTLRGKAGFARPGTAREEWDIGVSAPGSLESLFDAAGFEYAFLDLRHIGPGGEWLNHPVPARPLGYDVMNGEWPKIFDGMIYTREMVPSTPLSP